MSVGIRYILNGMCTRAFYDQEYCKAILVASAIAFAPIKYAFSEFLVANTSLQLAVGMSSIPLWIVFGMLYILPFIQKLKLTKDEVVFFLFLVLGFVPFFNNHPEEIGALVKTVYGSLVMAFPCYIVARSLKNYILLEKYLFCASYVINISMAYVMYRQVQANSGDAFWYSMSMAYMILPGAILAFRMLIRRFVVSTLANFLLSFFLLLFCGTRGPIVCLFAFIFYEIIINCSFGRKIELKKLLGIFMLIVFFAIGGAYVLNHLVDVVNRLNAVGLSSRTFWTILDGIFFSNSRSSLYNAAWKVITENPFTGVGILEDRFLIAGPRSTYFLGSYSHLVFLDWLIEYGIVFGGIISFVILVTILKIFIMPRSVYKSCMEFFFFCGFVPMLFSEHWMESKLFYVFLGLAVSCFWDYYPRKIANRRT